MKGAVNCEKKNIAIIVVMLVIIILIILEITLNISSFKKITSIEIIDNTQMCATALEEFYEDSQYKYYFSCIKSDNVYARINGKEK